MNRYHLYSEWRGITIIGESLRDAVSRVTGLQRPDEFAAGQLVKRGEVVGITKILGDVDTTGSKRGSETFESVLVELVGGQCVEIHARPEPIKMIGK